MKKMRIRKETIAPLLLFAAVLVMFWIRSTAHIPAGDEMRYYYTFEMKDGETNYFNFREMHPIEHPWQVIPSMANHYMHANGRVVVHTLEQFLSFGKWMEVFYVVNTGMFLLMLWLFIRLAVPVTQRQNPWVWLTTLFIFLYLFPTPGRLWVSVNLALNYLWPSILTLCVLIMWRSKREHCPEWKRLAIMSLISLLAGACNEAFSIPLCGALCILLIFRWRKTPKYKLWLLIPLSLGCVFLLASPGNWNRVSAATNIFSSYWEVLSQLWVVWILLVTLFGFMIYRREEMTRVIRRHMPSALALFFSLLFGVMAHTASRAFTAIELFSAVLLMNLIVKYLPAPSRILSFTILATFIVVHQVFITAEHVKQYRSIVAVTEQFKSQPNFALEYQYQAPPRWLEPYVYYQVPVTQGAYYEWNILGHHYSQGKRMLNAVDSQTLRAIEDIKFEKDTTAPLYPFKLIGYNAYVAPKNVRHTIYYDITDSQGRTSRSSTRHMRVLTSKGDTLRIAFLQPLFPSDSIVAVKKVIRAKNND